MSKTSKFFRVATEGATTDGRVIAREWLTQMAKNFNPAKYGARVWLEHMRGLYADSALGALGDVTGVECRQVEDGKMALFAQIKPLPALIEMNKKGQKIYTSIEVHPKFADSGEAYLTGLAVTDSPASLGTEVLAFAAQHPGSNPFAQRKSHPEALFSAAAETVIEFEDTAPTAPAADSALQVMTSAFSKLMDRFTPEKPAAPAAAVTGATPEVTLALGDAAKVMGAFADQQAKDSAVLAQVQTQFTALKKDHDALVLQLSQQTGPGTPRPPASGAGNFTQTDC